MLRTIAPSLMRRSTMAPFTSKASLLFAAQYRYASRYYTDSHEWVEVDGTNATIGITVHAQETLGDVVFVGLPSTGDSFQAKDSFGEVESVKATNDVYMPISGTVTAVNDTVKDDPSLLNKNPEGDGWLIKVKDVEMPEGLMDREAYDKFLDAE